LKKGFAMDRFFKEENVECYRRLASAATSDIERLQILKLFAAEIIRFKLELRETSYKKQSIVH
jgi:hypothetical protein